MLTTEAPLQQARHGIIAYILDVIFPPVCARCRKIGTLLCDDCLSQLVPVAEPVCSRCGRQLERQSAESASAACNACRDTPLLLDQMRAPLLYVEPASSIIHRLKYEGYFALAEPLGLLMAARWPCWMTPPDLVIPIPLHQKRQRQRGYNQSALLARPLANAKKLDYNSFALRRIRHTKPQVGLGPEDRAINVKDAFVADPASVAGRNILLIDDVLTTGATMRSAAETLLSAGAASVSAYCLARVA
jgi:ComF family protein